jgi:hypothetical protein
MKLLHVTFHFEYADAIELILDRHEITEYVRYPMVEGRDCEGKHSGTQVFPGSVSVVQAQVPEDAIDALLSDLRAFRDEKRAHAHLQAVVLTVDQHL